MTSIELAVVIGGVLASFTMCAVKIIHQIQNSKCRFIKCLGVECVRDTDIDLPEVRTGGGHRHQSAGASLRRAT